MDSTIKHTYKEPEIEILGFESADIITDSNETKMRLWSSGNTDRHEISDEYWKQ